jgi:hypothetical protein
MVVEYVEHDCTRLTHDPVSGRPLGQGTRLAKVRNPGTAAAVSDETLSPRPLCVHGRPCRAASGAQNRERIGKLAFRLGCDREPGVAGAACHRRR